MVFQIKRPAPKPVVTAPKGKTPVAPSRPPTQVHIKNEVSEEGGAVKSVTTRLAVMHQNILNNLQGKLECDRTEVMKRGLRLLNTVCSAPDARIVLIREDGSEETIPIMTDGVYSC